MARIVDKRTGKGIKQALAEGASGPAGTPMSTPQEALNGLQRSYNKQRGEVFDFADWNAARHANALVSRRDLRRFWLIMRAIEREQRWYHRLRRWWLASWYHWTHPAPVPAPDIAPEPGDGSTLPGGAS